MLALLIVFGLLIYSIVRYYQYTSKYPKGPWPLPFIGNFLEFNFEAQHKTFERLGKQQRGIYTIFTPTPYVQITDFQLIKEAFIEKGDDFTDRPKNCVMQEVLCFGRNSGIGNSNGDNWREQRRAALSIMRDFGMGKNLMEERVRSSISDYIHQLEIIDDKDNIMIANIINEVLFGFRYKHDESKPLIDYVEGFNGVLEYMADSKCMMFAMGLPALTKLPCVGCFTVGKLRSGLAQNKQFVTDNVHRAVEEYNPEEEPTCVAQAYKQKMKDSEYLDEPNLIATCGDFFLAGTETTATTLRWADKLRHEIQSVVGRDRLPSMADQPKMPFARACALEVQRYANVLPTNLQRETVRDTEIGGVKIPARTWVNADIHYLMANDPLFVNPKEFRPERYLHEDGTTLRKDLVERTLPFSVGKRACAGESLARVEIFLALTSTFQHFRISPVPGQTIDLDPRHNQIIQPKPQNLCLQQV